MVDPNFRGRRLRGSPAIRRLVRETAVSPRRLVLPLFVGPGSGRRDPVPSMPGVFRTSVDEAARDVAEAEAAGLGGVILFGIPEGKDAEGSEAWTEDGVVQRALRVLRPEISELALITDVCLCAYTSHGQCGIVEHGRVANEPTVERLARTAVSHAAAGADIVAPSDMMDGRVRAIRAALDGSGFSETPIMSYAVKYASAFYGPFRDAADSAPGSGDRKGYQMDPANAEEALREAEADLAEGADIILVKPAQGYLDIVRRVKKRTGAPVAAYQVSGEYSAVMAAIKQGWLDEGAMREAIVSIRRAGADMVITYWAREFARGAE